MKRFLTISGLTALLAFGAAAQQGKDGNALPAAPSPAGAAKAEAPNAAADGKPIAVDELFLEVFENYQWAQREIDRIEGLSGPAEIRVSIKELRKLSGEKLARLQAWMREHRVPPEWRYEQQGRQFLPPLRAPAAEQK